MGILVEAVQTVATMEHEQIHVDFAKRVTCKGDTGDSLVVPSCPIPLTLSHIGYIGPKREDIQC